MKTKRKNRGAAAAEFALVLPVFFLFVLTMAAAFGACSLPSGLLPLIWFFPESILRFGLAMSQSIPVGSVPGLVFWYVWRGIARGSAKA